MLQRRQRVVQKKNKQIKSHETDVAWGLLMNMNVKPKLLNILWIFNSFGKTVQLNRWTFTFRKVVRQQIWEKVLVLIKSSFFHISLLNLTVKILRKLVNFCRSYRKKIKWPTFSETQGILATLCTCISTLSLPCTGRAKKVCL